MVNFELQFPLKVTMLKRILPRISNLEGPTTLLFQCSGIQKPDF